MKKITLLLVDDHPVVRRGLCSILQLEPDFAVVGEAENGRQAVTLAKDLRPDLVVMDIGMPQLNGLEATRQILRHNPTTRVLILSFQSNDDYVYRLIAAGAAGYLTKQAAATHLVKAIREVHAGNSYYSSAIATRLQEKYRRSWLQHGRLPEFKDPREELTCREVEVVQLIAEGSGNKQIAAALSLSIKTVEKHRQAAMNKLNIRNTAGLTRYAIDQGIIEATPKLA